jgi:exopolysaccharide production protein ExoQ
VLSNGRTHPQFNFPEQLQLLSWALSMSALLSLLICLFIPSYGVVGVGLIVGQEEIVHSVSNR